MNNLLLLTTLLLALLAGCTKKEPTPTYHKDIFRCKVNGVEWVATCPSDGLFGCKPIDCQYYWKDTKTISLGAENRTGDNSTFQSFLVYKYKSEIGDNFMTYTTSTFSDFNKPSGCRFYTLDTMNIRRFTISSVDTINFIIIGSFEFTVFNSCLDTLKITEGEFHVNFRF